jgi:hypothetical protein
MSEKIQIELSKAEAVVLFEFLSRFSEKEILQIDDQSEARVLWNIHCDLEKLLAEPFAIDYKEILQKSREIVRDEI